MSMNFSKGYKVLFNYIGFRTVIFLLLIISISCSEDQSIIPEQKGTLVVNSNPPSAAIYISGSLTNKLTPATFELDKGSYLVKIKLPSYVASNHTVVIETGKTTYLDIDLVNINTLINIALIPNIQNARLYFTFQFNVNVGLEEASITHPTTDYGNYVIYTEQFNNININHNLTYRVPQSAINDFPIARGIFTFAFKGMLENEPFEKEVIYERN